MKRAWAIPLVLLFVVLAYGASVTSHSFVSGLFTYWVKTDTTLAVNMDTANALTRQYIIRLADSAAANRSGGAVVSDRVQIRYYGNFPNNANDSINLQIGVNGVYHAYILPYDTYFDRFAFHTTEPDAKAPSTFRDDLPRISTDSAFVVRLSRNSSFPAGTRAAVTIFKVAVNTGPQAAATAGVFYDMVRFDEAVFPTTGTSTGVVMILTLKRNR